MWIQTKSGKAIHLDGPIDPNDIVLDDIAHAIGMQTRFNGHCQRFYSVAEHSIQVMLRVRELGGQRQAQRSALMHDAAEAYVGDCPTPLKQLLPEFKRIEDWVMSVVNNRFGLHSGFWKLIKQADREVLAAEAQALFNPPPLPGWGDNMPDPWRGCEVVGYAPSIAKNRFLDVAESLGIS